MNTFVFCIFKELKNEKLSSGVSNLLWGAAQPTSAGSDDEDMDVNETGDSDAEWRRRRHQEQRRVFIRRMSSGHVFTSTSRCRKLIGDTRRAKLHTYDDAEASGQPETNREPLSSLYGDTGMETTWIQLFGARTIVAPKQRIVVMDLLHFFEQT